MDETTSTQIVCVYITAPDINEAKNLGRVLVQKKLAPCVNIIANVHSIYQWQGEIEEGAEVIL